MKFIDLFSGVGGLRLPFEEIGYECVFSSEINVDANKTYLANFKNKPLGDINSINPTKIPNHNILLAGFPCQAFSIAGKRRGFNDERGQLFFSITKILKIKKPKFVILENVKNLLTHNNGKTFKVITQNLLNLDYYFKYKILNSKNFGTPQNRERIYIIGFLNKVDCENFNFPQLHNTKYNINYYLNLKTKIENKYYYTNTKYEILLKKKSISNFSFYQIRRKYVRRNKQNICPTLTANMGTGGHNVPIIKTKYGFRKLTPRECFNLQGFPATFKLPKMADNKLYMQAGNSVSINIVKKLAKEIKRLNENN